MATEILMPALSPTMEEGKLARWLVKEGDEIAAGDVIAEIETDKATMEIEAIEDGKLAKVLIAEGAEGVKVNTPIAIVLEDGEELDSATAVEAKQTPTDPAPVPIAPPVATPVPAPTVKTAIEGSKVSSDTGMVEITVREALRDAMAEEMRLDDDVFVMGEEVAEYQGAYKVTQGLLAEFGERRVIDTPITEHGFAGIAVGAAFFGA